MTITIHDTTGFVAPGDVRALQGDARDWPFDVNLLVENAPDRSALERDAHAAVRNPNVIAIAIDPQLHHVVVRFGTQTGVKVGDYDSITRAGNAHLHNGEVRQAIDAIALRAKASREATTALSQSITPVIVERGISGATWFWLAALFVAGAAIVVWAWRRLKARADRLEKTAGELADEASELRSRNVEEAAWADGVRRANAAGGARTAPPGMPSPAPRMAYGPLYSNAPAPSPRVASTPVVVQQQVVQQGRSDDGLLTGVLLGEAIERDRGSRIERVERIDREVVVERESPRSADAGGADATWDGSGGGSSSVDVDAFDAGGGGSDYGGGGDSSGDSGSSDGGGSDF